MSRKKDPRITEHKDGIKPGPILLAIAVIMLGYFVLVKNRKTADPMSNSVSMQSESPVPKGKLVQVLVNKEERLDMKKYQDELNEKRILFTKSRNLGLTSLAFTNKADTISIPINISPNKYWCQAGDLDTMRHAAKSKDSKDFLITLEPIGPSGKSQFIRTSLEELYSGVNFTFTFPRPKSATTYGIYICSDSQQDTSCQRKTVSSHANLNDRVARNPGKVMVNDQTFYFQNLTIDDKHIEMYRVNDFGDKFQSSMSRHLKEKGINAADIKSGWELNKLLKSAPAEIRERKIVINLPYNDPLCSEGLKGR